MNKKTVRNLIIAGTVGLTATTVGLTTALTACSTTATQTFSAESIANLKSAITNAISNQKLTKTKFKADINNIIKNNFVAGDENMGEWVKFAQISPNNENEIMIELKSNAKYLLPEDFADSSVTLIDNLLFIGYNNLNFYKEISFTNDSLTQLRNDVLNSVSTIGVGNFNETELQNSSTIINAINNLKTSDNTNLGNYINTPTYSQETNSINITINDNIGLYKFNPVSLEGIQVNDSEITLNISSVMQPSPESWFTWGTGANANKIIGLSDEGKQQTRIVLPARATGLIGRVFYITNSQLSLVDMSLTSIVEIPESSQNVGMFENISTLEYTILPNTLETISGRYCFNNCKNLKSIVIPKEVKSIAGSSFNQCISLTSIEILSPSVTFENNSIFINVPSTCVATVVNSTIQQALVNAGFPGTIKIKSN